MAFIWLGIIFVFGAVFGDDSCPKKQEIVPCTCDGEGINCMGAKSVEEIKKAFKANFKYGGVRSVWVQATPITNLPADTFGKIRSQMFYIEVNQLTTLDTKAFNASRNSMHTLSLYGNKINNFDYGGLRIYERLGLLNLGKNEIETIPDDAFDNNNLFAIILSQNKITHIGKKAFGKLPRLTRLELALNQLTTLGPLSLAIPNHNEGLQINLAANRISEVSPSAFNGTNPYSVYFSQNQLRSLKYDAFGSLVTKVADKNGFLELSGNPLSCSGCDYSWIVLNRNTLAEKLVGFSCPDNRGVHEITKESIGCDS